MKLLSLTVSNFALSQFTNFFLDFGKSTVVQASKAAEIVASGKKGFFQQVPRHNPKPLPIPVRGKTLGFLVLPTGTGRAQIATVRGHSDWEPLQKKESESDDDSVDDLERVLSKK
jgi:hypothetical protein